MLDTKIPPPVIALLVVMIMYFSRDSMPPLPIPEMAKWVISSLLFLLGMSCGLFGIWAFKNAKTTLSPAVPSKTFVIVDSGIYGITRNPMYLGIVLCVAAAGIYLKHSGFLFFVAFTAIYLHFFQIKPEEKQLINKFGKSYEEYCNKVGRWL